MLGQNSNIRRERVEKVAGPNLIEIGLSHSKIQKEYVASTF